MAQTETALFAMGCFWCGAAAFANDDTNIPFKGIKSIHAGYAGGSSPNPTYKNHSGHLEAVRVIFDPSVISYEKLLDIFWHNIDPFDDKGQFCDKGHSYKAAVFYTSASQKQKALKSKAVLEKKLGRSFVTEIREASPFTKAEEEHQDYKKKHPVRYHFYKWNCGRSQRLKEVWRKK